MHVLRKTPKVPHSIFVMSVDPGPHKLWPLGSLELMAHANCAYTVVHH